MIDYLLRYDDEDDGKYQEEMMAMLKNTDRDERNVLETYITKDIGNVFFYWTGLIHSFCHFRPGGEVLGSPHQQVLSTSKPLTPFILFPFNSNGHPDHSEKLMICLDISPTIGLNSNVFNPITRNKKKILTHPIINTYIMVKYSCYSIIFLFTLIVKILFAILLSCLPLMLNANNANNANNNTNSANTDDNKANNTDDKNCIRDDYYLFWTVYALTIGTTFSN